MRSKQIVAAIFALIFFSSCSIDNLEPNHKVVGSSDIITVLGRVSNFTEQDVVTRSPKDNAERKVTSIAMAIFPVKNDGTGVNGNCVYYEYFPNSNEVMFAINRGDNTFNNGRYVIYAFANMPGMNVEGFGEGTSLEAMLSKAYNLSETTVDIPTDGFPMVGSLGDTFSKNTEKDNKILYIKPEGDSDPRIHEPIKDEAGEIVGWEEQGTFENTLTIPMKAMYAKINFSIKIDPIEKDETGTNFPPQFTFEGYKIKNIPISVDFDMATNSDTEVIDSIAGTGVEGKSILVDKDDELTFSFYLPERLLNPKTGPADFPYPFQYDEDYDEIVDKDQNGYRDEDEITRQRYKGLLLGDGQKATNVVISGKYRDHQNLFYDVDYTIHLGEDNYADFNILRNKEYNNYVTIKGIENSNDNQDNYISFDHRVNITRSQPAIITLRREMLLDSHFEIRPLRIRKNDIENVGTINAVKVEVVNPTTTNWMRIERSFGDGTPGESPQTTVNGEEISIYIDEDPSSPSYGKRRFFTYNLIDGVNATEIDATLKNSTEVILPITEDGECCWIYVDECIETGDGVRSGVVQVTYGNLKDNQFTPTEETDTFPIVKYTINQRKLFTVTNNGHSYRIEYEEEYLHNFDSEESYGSTDYEGLPWGLYGAQLSFDHRALYMDQSNIQLFTSIVNTIIIPKVTPYYDFYLTDDVDQGERHSRAGYDFTREIINDINDPNKNTGNFGKIDVLTLNDKPQSAVEYCYNKNKRTAKGQVIFQSSSQTFNLDNYNWYLPAIDEIEEIVMGQYLDSDGEIKRSYARFEDFQNKFYWSSQPAYLQNHAHYDNAIHRYGSYMTDNPYYARATSVNYQNGQYSSINSGMSGYNSTLHITFNGEWYEVLDVSEYEGNNYETPYVYYNGVEVEGPNWDSNLGYNIRTKMNRVRCVRKMP